MNSVALADYDNPVSPDYIEKDEQDIFDKSDFEYENLKENSDE